MAGQGRQWIWISTVDRSRTVSQFISVAHKTASQTEPVTVPCLYIQRIFYTGDPEDHLKNREGHENRGRLVLLKNRRFPVFFIHKYSIFHPYMDHRTQMIIPEAGS